MHPGRQRSPLYELADVLIRDSLGVSLSEWMLAERSRVDRRSWPRMALQLATLTQGRVSTTTVTLRSWFNADQECRAVMAEDGPGAPADLRQEGSGSGDRP